MRIRKKYYPCYQNSEAQFIRKAIKCWVEAPKCRKIFLKWKRNFLIAVARPLVLVARPCAETCMTDRYCRGLSSWYEPLDLRVQRTLPISLTVDDLIFSLKQEFKERSGIDIVFQKDLAKSLNAKEKESSIQSERKKLKEENQYLLDLIEELSKNRQIALRETGTEKLEKAS